MILREDISRQVARYLLEIEAVKLSPKQPFQWASGWKSPIYCDNRVTLSYPHIRTYIKEQIADVIKGLFSETDMIAGVATAGIPQGALVSDILQLPFAYVRPEPKKHGVGNQVEGRIIPGSSIVLIEDLISTGGSSLKAILPLRETGAIVKGVIAIFDYGFGVAEMNFKEAGIPHYSLSGYDILVQEALNMDFVSIDDMMLLSSWRQAPDKWGL